MGGGHLLSGHLSAQDPKLWDGKTCAVVSKGQSWDLMLACWFKVHP